MIWRKLAVGLGIATFGLLPLSVFAARVALVIGNAAYQEAPLRNPVNDARAMTEKLRGLSFQVITQENLKVRDIGRTLQGLRNQIRPGDEVLFFYAGHGLQVKGINYLPAVDAQIHSEEDVALQSINVTAVLDLLEESRAGVKLVFLDACRNNPYARSFRSGGTGLSKVGNAPSGTLISFATRPGSVAADGVGQNGLYTENLLRHITTPNQPIEQMLKRVALGVEQGSQGKQEPWIEGSIKGDFYFAQGGAAPQFVEQSLIKPTPTNPNNANSAMVYRPRQEFKDCDVCPSLVVMPSGSFVMGSPESEAERDEDESPRHRVNINYSFAVGKFEVTFAEWDACVAANACQHRPRDMGWGRGQRPVGNVSWDDAQEYVRWLQQKTGKPYRLLSEAEWEYVARAGTTTPFAAGQHVHSELANFDSTQTYNGSPRGLFRRQTLPVGSFPANPFGLHDMNGNVWEWVQDCYEENYQAAPNNGAAVDNRKCIYRSVRGGSWADGPRLLRSAARLHIEQGWRHHDYGFRVARNLP